MIAEEGSKAESKWDFLVKYQSPGKRVRSPAHIHLVIDMYMKRMGNPSRTNELVDYMVRTLIEGAKPATGWLPKLEYFDPAIVRRFEPLDSFGEFSCEFILAVQELIAKSEKTNYPDGVLNRDLWTSFRRGDEIFAVVSKARFRGAK